MARNRSATLGGWTRIAGGYSAAAGVSLFAGVGVAAGDSLINYRTGVAVLFAVGALSAAAAFLPPNALFALSFAAFGLEQVSKNHPIHAGHITVYAVDGLFVLLLLRSLLRRDRAKAQGSFSPITRLALIAWLAVMAVAAVHGWVGGTRPVSVLRIFAPTVYLFGFYVMFSRLARERTFDRRRALRDLIVLSVGFAVFMGLMRLMHHPFENPNAIGPDGLPIGNKLGRVVAANGTTFHRDYGFSTAFSIYPVLALASLAALTEERKRRQVWMLVFIIGVLATLATLIRGEIYGFLAGAGLVMILARTPKASTASIVSPRLAALLASIALMCGAVLMFALASPNYAAAVLERAVPLLHQSQKASSTATYRLQAIRGGIDSATRDPLGHGFVSNMQVASAGLDPGFLAHSSVAFMLIYAGWPGLITGLLATIAMLFEAIRQRAAPAWSGRALAAIGVMLVVASLGGVGVFGEIEIAGFAALLAALRFQQRVDV